MKLGHMIDDSRKKYPELTNELLENLQNWAKERGLPKIPEEQLALFAHSCYFDLEASKQCMDVYYRMRSTIPEFFSRRDTRLEYLQYSLKVLQFAVLPKPDRDGNHIIFHRIADSQPSHYMFNDVVKLLLMTIEGNMYTEGCSSGYVLLVDLDNLRFGHLARLSIRSIQRYFEYIQDGLPIRLKAIRIFNTIWFMDKLLALIRPFMKREFYKMLHIYDNVSDVYPYVPLEFLPKDYGGELESIEILHKAHCAKLDQLRDYFIEDEALFQNYSYDTAKKTSNYQAQEITQDASKNSNDR